MSTVALVRAGVPDCEAILQMQKASFAVLLEKYQDYDINPELLKSQVERELRKRRAVAKKATWRAVTAAPRLRDPVNPEANQHQKAAKSEEMILCFFRLIIPLRK